jgi:hypothetical protein
MATKITTDIIKQINELYIKLGTYAAVARELGIAASTVKKYVVADYRPISERTIKKFDPIVDMPTSFSTEIFDNVENFGDLCSLSDEEALEIVELWEELSI